jgi:hypothetical protein
MATGRMLKRNISESRRLSELKSDSARLLWTWIIPYLDSEGRFFATPAMIKGKVVPRLNTFTLKNIPRYLRDMADVGLIILYEVDGEKILEYRKFSEFQKIVKDREARSLPAPKEGEELSIRSRPTHDKVSTKSKQPESNLIESNLIESKAKGDREERPVDNSQETDSWFAGQYGRLRQQLLEKAPRWQAPIDMFVQSHFKDGTNRKAIIDCLRGLFEAKEEIKAPKLWLEKRLSIKNGTYNEAEYLKEHKDDKGTKEGDKAAMENLGNILKTMKIPLPEKEICLKCNNPYSPSLIENGTCVFCNPGIVTTQCPQCTRTVGKNILDRKQGICIHCIPKIA